MKKHILIPLFICIAAGSLLFLYRNIDGQPSAEDPVRMEDAIIIHGIQMDSDVPPAEDEDGVDGKIIYNDSFGDSIIDYEKAKKQKDNDVITIDEMKEFDSLKAKDKRWHLCRYQIKKNDNLWKIAKLFGIHQHLIISINNIHNPDMLRPGNYIHVPTRRGIYYLVRKGDTVSKIAGRYKIAVKHVTAHNRLNGGLIRPGQKIFLPDAHELRAPAAIGARKRNGVSPVAAELRNFIWPLRGRITSGFGNRRDPLYGQRQFHCGIDISANVGTPVHASGNGRVIFNGWKTGYGNCVIVRHDGGYITVYAHNSKNIASVDSQVKQGDIIAYSGMTGAVTGAHLHFEIRKYINPLNPLRLLHK
jgi:murein DD-endopeptidase MepM/ murein hydrolase activator NlpD